MVRPRRADDGDEPPVPRLRHDPGAGGVVEGGRAEAAAPARRGRVATTSGRRRWASTSGPTSPTAGRIGSTPDDPMPEDFSFQLFPDDLERIAPIVEDAMRRVPILEEAGLQRVINGPIPYAPDGNPLIGPMPGVPDAFEACVFTFGICQAGRRGQGAGRVGDARADRVGHVVLRSAPLHGLHGPGLLRGQGDGDLRARIRHPLPPPRLARRAAAEGVGGARPVGGAGRAVRGGERLGAGAVVCAARRRHVRGRDADLAARRALAAARARGMPRGAGRGGDPRPAGLLALRAGGAGGAATGSRSRSRGGCRGPGGWAWATSPTRTGASSPRCRS